MDLEKPYLKYKPVYCIFFCIACIPLQGLMIFFIKKPFIKKAYFIHKNVYKKAFLLQAEACVAIHTHYNAALDST